MSTLRKPELQESYQPFELASQHELPVLGTVTLQAETEDSQLSLGFNVTELPELNLLRRNAIKQLGILVENLMQQIIPGSSTVCRAVFEDLEPDVKLQNECRKSCEEFPDVFKPEVENFFA